MAVAACRASFRMKRKHDSTPTSTASRLGLPAHPPPASSPMIDARGALVSCRLLHGARPQGNGSEVRSGPRQLDSTAVMPLTAGQPLSFYEILGPLGAGGMGEVYRARDTRLEREVAIKVLPEHFAEDEERLRRFEREAKSLASLNHPNVAQIFGVDQIDDTCFLVLELVPGETLEDRIARGALPMDEASMCAARSPRVSKPRTTPA